MRLRRSTVSGPGIRRRRRGRGFSYQAPDGGPVTPADLERIQALVIPPAWQDVWICPWPNGHIQAVGTDEAGRRQYLYHQEWRRQRDEQKYDRVLDLAPALPDFRRAIARDLVGRGWPRPRSLAVALRMLDYGVFRTGSDQYSDLNGTYGVATLLRHHVTVRGPRVAFDFTAKGGLDRTLTLEDAELSRAVAGLKRVRSSSERLLVYRARGGVHELHSDDLNQRFKELVGQTYAVKDLRTWNATVLAAAALAAQPPAGSQRATRRAETAVLREVSDHLGNTPAVARKSYVDPRLFDLYERGVTVAPALTGVDPGDLRTDRVRVRVEQAVLELLAD